MTTLIRMLALVAALFLAPMAPTLASAPAAGEPALAQSVASQGAVLLAQASPAAPLLLAQASAPAAAPAEQAKPAEATPPTPNKGDTAWMIVATLLVTLMCIPGLALFYGGLVRAKNMLSVLMQVFTIFAVISVLWAIYGYTLAFGGDGSFYGTFDKLFLKGVTPDTVAATFSKGVVIPELIFVAFQATFAAITCALIVGSIAERARFSAVILFSVLWFTFCYIPMAHMVWYWAGPDAITDEKSLEAVTAAAGFLWAKGALDFAGGTVVHQRRRGRPGGCVCDRQARGLRS